MKVLIQCVHPNGFSITLKDSLKGNVLLNPKLWYSYDYINHSDRPIPVKIFKWSMRGVPGKEYEYHDPSYLEDNHTVKKCLGHGMYEYVTTCQQEDWKKLVLWSMSRKETCSDAVEKFNNRLDLGLDLDRFAY